MDYERRAELIKTLVVIMSSMVFLFIAIHILKTVSNVSLIDVSNTMIETSEETSQEDNVIDNNQEESVLEFAPLTNSIFDTLENILLVMPIIMAIVLGLTIFKYTFDTINGDICISDFKIKSSNSFDSFYSFINNRKEQKINDKLIYNTILKSNKKIDNADIKFLQNCIEVKTEWYSFKKEIVEVDNNEKLFSVLLLDVLANLDSIRKYFQDEENKCEDIKDTYCIDFESYIRNEKNYFNINDSYYLKELVLYVLTNNNIKVKELYTFISKSTKRANISCIVANFIESELSLGSDMSVSKTIEESVKVFNNTYNLDLNVGIAKNLIFLSKIDNDKQLEKEILQETTLLDEMKEYKHYLYA